MNADEKQLAISLIRAFEDLWIERSALTRLAEIHRIPPHVRDAAVASLRNDQTIVAIARARFHPLYDLSEHAPDVSTVVQSLLATIR